MVGDSFVYNCSLLLLLSFVITAFPWTVCKHNRFWDQTLLNRKPVLHILKTCCHLSPAENEKKPTSMETECLQSYP
uniref:Secreted protein n=1 Tax=Romanomermis culicivorax TaxID=13658 RepID=A0A915K0P1_ROMCU